jgi:hypothetical protein
MSPVRTAAGVLDWRLRFGDDVGPSADRLHLGCGF